MRVEKVTSDCKDRQRENVLLDLFKRNKTMIGMIGVHVRERSSIYRWLLLWSNISMLAGFAMSRPSNLTAILKSLSKVNWGFLLLIVYLRRRGRRFTASCCYPRSGHQQPSPGLVRNCNRNDILAIMRKIYQQRQVVDDLPGMASLASRQTSRCRWLC